MDLDILYISGTDVTNLQNAIRQGEEIDISIGEVKLRACIEKLTFSTGDNPLHIFDVSMTLSKVALTDSDVERLEKALIQDEQADIQIGLSTMRVSIDELSFAKSTLEFPEHRTSISITFTRAVE